MIKIKLLSIGKHKEAWLQEALQEYEKRLSSRCQLEWMLAKNELQFEELFLKQPHLIALDSQGKQFDSLQFSKWFLKQIEESGGRLVFAIGGADGLSAECKKRASFLLSLSALTFTNQISRLILVEQLYRALEIGQGSRYHH